MPYISQMPDTRIPLSNMGGGRQSSGMSGMFGTLGQLMQIKEQQSIMQQRQLREEQERRDLEDDDAIRSTMTRYERPDEGINDLVKQGRWSAATKAATQLAVRRKAENEDYDKRLETNAKRIEQATQHLQGLKGNPAAAVMYKSMRPFLVEMLQPSYGKGIDDALPTEYDPDRIDVLVAGGTKRAEQLGYLRDSAASLNRAYENGALGNPYLSRGVDANGRPIPPALDATGAPVGAMWSEKGQAARQDYRRAVTSALKAAGNQQEWQTYIAALHDRGIPEDILTEAPDWNDDPKAYQQSLKDFSTTQKEKDEAAKEANRVRHEKEMEAAARERNRIAAERAKNAGDGTGTDGRGKTISATRDSELLQARNTANRKLDDAYRPSGDEKGGLKFDTPEDRRDYGSRRIQHENDYRTASRRPTMEEEAEAAVEAGDLAAYDKVAKEYNKISGGIPRLSQSVPWRRTAPASRPAAVPTTPRERQQAIDGLMREYATADPTRQAEISAEITRLRTRTRQ